MSKELIYEWNKELTELYEEVREDRDMWAKKSKELYEENLRLKRIEKVAALMKADKSILATLMDLNNRLVCANQLINKLKKCDNCKENTTLNPYCIDCENHSKWELGN